MRAVPRYAIIGVVILGAACTGAIDGAEAEDEPEDGGEAASGDEAGSGGGGRGGSGGGEVVTPPRGITTAAPARMRRLTADEIKSSVRDIYLGGIATMDDKFPLESQRHDFDNQYDRLSVSVDLADAVAGLADRVARAATAPDELKRLHACDVATSGEATCARSFIETYGKRTYRRPLRDDETTSLLELFSEARKTTDYAGGLATVIEALIASPHFLFRREHGGRSTPAPGNGIVGLDGYEIASALSYFLWRSTPDDALLAAAGAGRLVDRSGIVAEARRMLGDRRATAGLRAFLEQWIELPAPEAMSKADPAFTPALAAAMVNETRTFMGDVLGNRDGSFEALFNSSETFVNADLGKLYGATVTGPELRKTELDAARRAGFLTQAGFLAGHTPGGGFSPIFLGLFVRSSVLCQPLPPPPPGVPEVSNDPNLTTRERFARHSQDPSCEGCHKLLDPIGYGFEQYDVLGRFVTTDKGAPLSGEGVLNDTDVDGPFKGAVELASRLSSSAEVRACFSAQMLKFLLGRETARKDKRLPLDGDAIAGATSSWSDDMRELAVALVTSDAFLYRDTSRLGVP